VGRRQAPADHDRLAAGDAFLQFVDPVAPETDDVVASIEAYFDESYGDGGPLCVGGFAFTKLHCRALDRAWRSMLARYRRPFLNAGRISFSHEPVH